MGTVTSEVMSEVQQRELGLPATAASYCAAGPDGQPLSITTSAITRVAQVRAWAPASMYPPSTLCQEHHTSGDAG